MKRSAKVARWSNFFNCAQLTLCPTTPSPLKHPLCRLFSSVCGFQLPTPSLCAQSNQIPMKPNRTEKTNIKSARFQIVARRFLFCTMPHPILGFSLQIPTCNPLSLRSQIVMKLSSGNNPHKHFPDMLNKCVLKFFENPRDGEFNDHSGEVSSSDKKYLNLKGLFLCPAAGAQTMTRDLQVATHQRAQGTGVVSLHKAHSGAAKLFAYPS